MAVVPNGRPARTLYTTLGSATDSKLALLSLLLETGRTHQIRVHLKSRSWPLIGDPVYGVGWERGMGGPTHAWAKELARSVGRQFLHAAELAFDHPISGERMRFEAPLPNDLARVATWARGDPQPGPELAPSVGPR